MRGTQGGYGRRLHSLASLLDLFACMVAILVQYEPVHFAVFILSKGDSDPTLAKKRGVNESLPLTEPGAKRFH